MSMPAEPAMRWFLDRVLPGRSRRIALLRDEILDFCGNPTARTVLLQGPIGSGKSTIARAIALLKRVAPLNAEAASEIISAVAFDGPYLVHLTSIPWYVELPLTGLVAELADLQLFGSIKGAFTGATDRPGVFEQAMFGRRKRGVDKLSEAVEMTQGVVFLDEVGDLQPMHQAKLLPVLSGGAFYRIGTEANADAALTFRGTLVTATWKTLTGGLLRADLLSRIGSNRFVVPSLSDRMEDFEEILSALETAVRARIIDAIDHIVRADPLAAKDYWAHRRQTIPTLSAQDRKRLGSMDWARHGNLRGLTAVVELVLNRGLDPVEAVETFLRIDAEPPTAADPISVMLDGLLRRGPTSGGLAGHVSALEDESRALLRDRLRGDRTLLSQLAHRLDIPLDTLLTQVHQLARTRRRAS
jgi:DNA-binding NtrC family response regulator